LEPHGKEKQFTFLGEVGKIAKAFRVKRYVAQILSPD